MLGRVKILIAILFGAVMAGTVASGQESLSTNAPMPLWPNGAPGAMGTEPKDIPTLTVFLPPADKSKGAAFVICPGGGYGGLAAHEGEGYAHWLNEIGVTAFVLKYRLGSAGYRHPREMQDAERAMRMVRYHAADWKIDPKRIGIIGSSAGGHLASTVLTHFDAGQADAADPIDRVSCRPDIGVLCYPVITMGELTHQGSKENLLGKDPSPELVRELSNELHVTKDTPPCFLFHTADDTVVPVENSLNFALALRKAGVPFEIHVYQHGAHGLGLGTKSTEPSRMHPWVHECERWFRERNFVN